MDPLEEGAVHQAMPQETKEHGAQTSEEVQVTTDRPQTNDFLNRSHASQGRNNPSDSDRRDNPSDSDSRDTRQ